MTATIPALPLGTVQRAAELALSGRVLLVGPPGTAKTRIASSLVDALPPLSDRARIEVETIHRLAGLPSLPKERPFRAPHHTVSGLGLAGRGFSEAKLATHGVLFLDELPEFTRGAVEFLAEVLRRDDSDCVHAPLRPLVVVASALPCPCGWYGHHAVAWADVAGACTCAEGALARYSARLATYAGLLNLGAPVEVSL